MSIQPSRPTLRIETPRVFLPLLGPKRFKGARGGRGSGKSHHFAGALVEDCLFGQTRAACVREIQYSIKDSSKQLIEDKIAHYGLSEYFRITDQEISGPNDSLFIFRGLQNHTATSIKSLEGFTRCWVDEAQTITQRSLDILTPTFRSNSELMFSWNPAKADDPVEQLFAQNKGDPDFALVTATYADNPWFPDELRRDMERDKARDPDKYGHVWLGQYLTHSEACVFRNWVARPFETPKGVTFYFGADWGFSIDPTVLVRCYIDGRTLFVDREAYEVGCEIDRTPALFDKLDPDDIGMARRWPITADSARPETISHMRRNGYDRMKSSIKGAGSLQEGVEFLRSFDIVVHPRCKNTVDELTMYSYKVDKKTDKVVPILEDKKNHVIDALRYAVEDVRRKAPTASSVPMRG